MHTCHAWQSVHIGRAEPACTTSSSWCRQVSRHSWGSTVTRSEFLNALSKVLDEALEADHADFGNIQRLVPGRNVLEIVVQRGFSESFLQFFKFVSSEDDSACGRAIRLKQRVAITDILEDPWYGPYVGAATEAGYRAVQSTPIVGPSGELLGVVSTHFRSIHQFSRNAALALDACVAKAASIMLEYDREGSYGPNTAVGTATRRAPRSS